MEALLDLRPNWKFRGLGGPKMQERAGSAIRDWVNEAAVVGLWEVLKRYGWFKQRFDETRREIEDLNPAGVIFIDYPGFNLRLARALREGGCRAKLVDYISPQVWAWNRSRIPRVAQWLDLMLCLFPFEREMFEEAGLKTVWMGHPMVDQLEAGRTGTARDRQLVGLFPGSREREVARLFPVMVEVVKQLHERHPEWRFEASAASKSLELIMRRVLEENDGRKLPIEVVASGTATLEATYYGLPYCLVYKVAWPTYLAGRALVDLDHLGMANILAGREIVHEFIQHDANTENIASFVESVMTDEVRRNELERNLLETGALLGERGAARRAAEAIVDLLES
jgi:lipid-A-disaccharide synthase